jgi:hypothetical protein
MEARAIGRDNGLRQQESHAREGGVDVKRALDPEEAVSKGLDQCGRRNRHAPLELVHRGLDAGGVQHLVHPFEAEAPALVGPCGAAGVADRIEGRFQKLIKEADVLECSRNADDLAAADSGDDVGRTNGSTSPRRQYHRGFG